MSMPLSPLVALVPCCCHPRHGEEVPSENVPVIKRDDVAERRGIREECEKQNCSTVLNCCTASPDSGALVAKVGGRPCHQNTPNLKVWQCVFCKRRSPVQKSSRNLDMLRQQRQQHCIETCHQRDFGSFKYCGLRPEPFASASPPTCKSWTAKDIPLPATLDSAVSSKIFELESRLEDLLMDGGHGTDRCTLFRFLREMDLNVDKAEQFFRVAAKWKRDHDTERALTHWNLALYERCLAPWWPSGGFLGHGRDGAPVVLERFGQCHWSSIFDNVPIEVLEKNDIVHTLRTIAACEEDAARRGVPFVGATLIEDLDGISWRKFKLTSLRALGKVLMGRLYLAPQTGKRIIIINAPRGFPAIWKMCKNLLVKPHTAALVQIVNGKEFLPTLRLYMDDAVIPAYLGGSKSVDGDPECRMLLAPGGEPPASVFREMNELITRESVQKRSH